MKLLGVRFREIGKIYYYLSDDDNIKLKDMVIATTKLGVQCGEVLIIKDVGDDDDALKAEKILRKATPEDLDLLKEKRVKELNALSICKEKVNSHKLKMKLIDAEYMFDYGKLIFYFVAESRVDFRVLVRELARIFKVRIELRQIGIRDEAKMIGDIGICGRKLCCASFLNNFQSVSVKMAKDQNLSLNPSKLSGVCGRLMCCLKYEQDTYRDILKQMPKIGETVKTDSENGVVTSYDALKELVEIECEVSPEITERKSVRLSDIIVGD